MVQKLLRTLIGFIEVSFVYANHSLCLTYPEMSPSQQTWIFFPNRMTYYVFSCEVKEFLVPFGEMNQPLN